MRIYSDGRVLVVQGFSRIQAIFQDPWNVLDGKLEESATPALLTIALFGERDHRLAWPVQQNRVAEKAVVCGPLGIPSTPLPCHGILGKCRESTRTERNER